MATITKADAVNLQILAEQFGVKAGAAGFKASGGTYDEYQESKIAEKSAWDALTKKLWAIANAEDSPEPEEAAGGVKSTPISGVYVAPKIEGQRLMNTGSAPRYPNPNHRDPDAIGLVGGAPQ